MILKYSLIGLGTLITAGVGYGVYWNSKDDTEVENFSEDDLSSTKSKLAVPLHSEAEEKANKSRQKLDSSLQEHGYEHGSRPNI